RRRGTRPGPRTPPRAGTGAIVVASGSPARGRPHLAQRARRTRRGGSEPRPRAGQPARRRATGGGTAPPEGPRSGRHRQAHRAQPDGRGRAAVPGTEAAPQGPERTRGRRGMICHLPSLLFATVPSATVTAGDTPGRVAVTWRSPMHELRCTPLLLFALSATVTAGWLADRGLILDHQKGFGSIAEARSAQARLQGESEEFDHSAEIVRRSIDTKVEAAADLIAGRLSLLAAAGRFRAASAGLPSR